MLRIQLGGPGLGIGAANSTVKGLVINPRGEGIHVSGFGTTGNIVIGNYVDSDASSTQDLSNFLVGELLTVRLTTSSGHDGRGTQRDSIFSSDGLGIDLLGGTESAAGVADFGPGAADSGPNGLQDFPIVTSVDNDAIEGTLNSKPSITYTVQLYTNPFGEDEGKTFVGQTSVTTDGGGNASFGVKPPSKDAKRQNGTAMPADSEGNTSEFSAHKTR